MKQKKTFSFVWIEFDTVVSASSIINVIQQYKPKNHWTLLRNKETLSALFE